MRDLKLPIMWRDKQSIGFENALEANLGIPNLFPPNLAPDITIKNLILSTFPSATPYKSHHSL